MLVYLSKRIALPNGTVISSVAWNEDQGWLACGGAGGLLKVLKVDGGAQAQRTGGLSVNQTLEGHDATVTSVAWNNVYQKLTSCDENGQIVVWMLHKNMWFEEMVNNRNKSRVADLAWSVDGTKVCIAYEDGAVIVGGVDGNRLWGRELKYELAKVCWSVDDRLILFGTTDGAVYAHDASGGQIVSQVNVAYEGASAPLAGIAWSPAWIERPEPPASLAIVSSTGKVQLMRAVGDESPLLLDTGMLASFAAWNAQGTALAIAGVAPSAVGDSSSVVTHFFNNEGIHLRTLRVAGKRCGGVAWGGDGLRVALAVDSSVYFANVRPDYRYCYLKRTVVYAFTRPERLEDSIMFWNTRNNERSAKSVRGLLYLGACKDACVIVSRPDAGLQRAMVQLVNAIGSPLDTRFIDLQPYVCAMNSFSVVCCGEEAFYLWLFRDPTVVVDDLDPISMQASRHTCQERIVHTEDIVRPDTAPTMAARSALTNDLICAACVSEELLVIGRESGLLHIYQLNPLYLVAKLLLPSRVHSLALNCNSTLLSAVDLGGVMRVYPLQRDKFSLVPRKAEPQPDFERKDVWSVRWALDDPHLLAAMEKTRLFIFNTFVAEDPVQSCANLCAFESLEVRALQLDEVMQDPERPRKEYVMDFEAKALRDLRQLLADHPLAAAVAYAEQHAHPRLWAVLAEHALAQLDFDHAEAAFVRCRDYSAIQFSKRVRQLDDPRKQAAEVHAHYHRVDEAERLYKEMDRKDLALEMRMSIGDWFGVVRLVQEGGGDEALMTQAWQNIGDHYASLQRWSKAAHYYTQCRNYRQLAHVFYIVEDFEMLAQLIDLVEHDKPLLLTLGGMFLSVGLAQEAARAYLAAGEVGMAVEGSMQLSQWQSAVALATEHHQADVSVLLRKHAAYLIQRDRLAEAIELYRKAGQHDEAAKILADLGQRAALSDPLKAKRFYVLSALEVELYRKKNIALDKDGEAVVQELLLSDHTTVSSRTLDAAWRGAEAFHFYLVCQQHILDSNVGAALVVAMRLTEYDDLVPPVDSYSLIALTAYLAGNFGICSKALTRLEAAEQSEGAAAEGGGGAAPINFSMDLDVTRRTGNRTGTSVAMPLAGSALSGTTTALQSTSIAKATGGAAATTYPTVPLTEPPRRFGDLAVRIFTSHPPVDVSVDSVRCPTCGSFNKEWASSCTKCGETFGVCMMSGRAIVADEDAWQCPVCRHRTIETEGDHLRNCPLCHTPKKQRLRRGL